MTGLIEKTVFISYRHANKYIALAIYQDLRTNGYEVFIDYESINSGDFEQIIVENIKAHANFVVVLTPSALDRCTEPDDWFRREIETAMEFKRNIVPILMEGFQFGDPNIKKNLTGKLELLKNYQGLEVPMNIQYFKYAMKDLRNRYLNIELDAVLHPTSQIAQKAARQQAITADSANIIEQKELTAQEWFERGYSYAEEDKLNEAFQCYSEAIRLQPSFAYAYTNRCDINTRLGKLNEALLDANEAIRLDDAYAYNNRGIVFGQLGELDNAIADFDKAIRLQPTSAPAHSNRGRALMYKNDLDTALKELNQAIILNPLLADAYYNRATTYYAKGIFEKALADYNQVIELQPKYVNAYINRSALRGEIGDLDGALSDADTAIRLKPDLEEAYSNRGLARRMKSDFIGAISDFSEFIRLKPNHSYGYFARGKAYQEMGELENAMADYDYAIRLMPDYAAAFFCRGTVWEIKNNFSSSITDYKKYLELGGGIKDGNQKEIEEKIKGLKRKLVKIKNIKKKTK